MKMERGPGEGGEVRWRGEEVKKEGDQVKERGPGKGGEGTRLSWRGEVKMERGPRKERWYSKGIHINCNLHTLSIFFFK